MPRIGINNGPSFSENLLPALDNTYTLGSPELRWASMHVGEGTIFITDAITGDQVGLTVSDGVFFLDGIAQAQLPRLVVDELVFPDNSTQTTAYIPLVETDYEVLGGTSGTQPTFDGDPLFTGSYIKNGANQVHFQIQVDMDNITDFGTGQYYMTLPFPSKYEIAFRDGCVHDGPAGGTTYHISGQVAAGSNIMTLWSTDRDGPAIVDVPFTATSAFTLSTADNFHIAGNYIAEAD